MEPPPELTLTTRGVLLDFLRSGAKDSSINRGPVGVGLEALRHLLHERAWGNGDGGIVDERI
jgi:hypothetical protein